MEIIATGLIKPARLESKLHIGVAPAANWKLHSAIGLLSAAIIAFQLALMQVFSIVQWYHFAYMAISVALLGFGAAGTFLSLFEKWLRARHEQALPPR